MSLRDQAAKAAAETNAVNAGRTYDAARAELNKGGDPAGEYFAGERAKQTPPEPDAPAPGPQQAARDQAALEASVQQAQDRHGVPEAHVWYPERDAFGDGSTVIGKDASRAVEVRRPAEAPRLVMGTPLQLTEQQYRVLLAGINPNRVSKEGGQSHLEAWDVRRYLTKIFGFGGWSAKTIKLEKIHERIVPKPGSNDRFQYTVVYEAQVALTIFNPDGTVGAYFEDGATGDGINMPSYQKAADFALKTALSQALKRCAVSLGDQFGLSLYNKGSVDPQVEITLRPPVWEGGTADEETIKKAVSNDAVHGEETPEGVPAAEDPGEDSGVNGLPDAKELRDEAVDKGVTLARLRQIYSMVNRKKGDHPSIGQEIVVNETGEDEPLDYLIYRRIQEIKGDSK